MNSFAERNLLAPSRRELSFGVGFWIAYLLLYRWLLSTILLECKVDILSADGIFLFNILFYILCGASAIFIFRRFLLLSFAPVRESPLRFFTTVAIGLCVYYLAALALSYLLALIKVPVSNQNQETMEALLSQQAIFMGLCSVLLAPLVEEPLVRGMLFAPLCKKQPWLGYLVSVVVFGGLHILDSIGMQPFSELFISFVQYIPAGLCLAWVYQRTRTIYAPLLLHALINLISILIIVL